MRPRADPGRRRAPLHRAAQGAAGESRLRDPLRAPSLEPVLSDTLGAIVFQDQVLEVATAFAGFRAGEAEGLRRAMSRKRSEAAIRAYEEKFVAGAIERGAARETAERVWSQIVGFSGFGFPKAHSAAFGLLAYQSTWLRVLPPRVPLLAAERAADGLLPPGSLVHEAQRVGVDGGQRPEAWSSERPGAPGQAGSRTTARCGGARLRQRSGRIRAGGRARRRRPWRSLGDLAARSGASAETLGKLAWAGACDALAEDPSRGAAARRSGSWASPCRGCPWPRAPSWRCRSSRTRGRMRALSAWERMLADYGSTGVTLREHPLQLMRPGLPADLSTSAQLERTGDGRRVRVAGLVIARQRPATAKGITFMLLEDELGTINLIVPLAIQERFRLAVRASRSCWRPAGWSSARNHQRPRRPHRAAGAARPAAGEGHAHRAAPRLEHRGAGGGRPARGRPGRAQLRQARALARQRLPVHREVDAGGVEGDRQPVTVARPDQPEPQRPAEHDEAAVGRPGELVTPGRSQHPPRPVRAGFACAAVHRG